MKAELSIDELKAGLVNALEAVHANPDAPQAVVEAIDALILIRTHEAKPGLAAVEQERDRLRLDRDRSQCAYRAALKAKEFESVLDAVRRVMTELEAARQSEQTLSEKLAHAVFDLKAAKAGLGELQHSLCRLTLERDTALERLETITATQLWNVHAALEQVEAVTATLTPAD